MKSVICGLLSIIMASLASSSMTAAPVAIPSYSSQTGELYIYSSTGMGVVGFEVLSGMPLNLSVDSKLGTLPPLQFDAKVIAFHNYFGDLPSGLFSIGPVLTPGLSYASGILENVGFSYTPWGMETIVVPIAIQLPAPAGISATYDPATGDVIFTVGESMKALLLESDGRFLQDGAPQLGVLAPAQFDSSNLMFFSADKDVDPRMYRLSSILPPHLHSSQISFSVMTDSGLSVSNSFAFIPEPSSEHHVFLALVAISGFIRRSTLGQLLS